MDRRSFFLACCALATARKTAASRPSARVAFLNPGDPLESDFGAYWRGVNRYMTIAASTLSMRLEVMWAQRDAQRMLRQCEAVALRSRPPDYVVIASHLGRVDQLLGILERSPTKVFLLHNGLTAGERHRIGHERRQFANWIGSAGIDFARGSHLLMEHLDRRLAGERLRVVGLMGVRDAPITLERVRGAQEYFARHARGEVLQFVYDASTSEDGQQKADLLLSRYPQANVLWAAHDAVALGAARSVAEHRARVLVAGMGGTGAALASVARGGLGATVCGYDLLGAWALVLLHDHHHGRDFSADGGTDRRLDGLYVVDRANVDRYRESIVDRNEGIDFRAYSRLERNGPYDLRLERLLKRPYGEVR